MSGISFRAAVPELLYRAAASVLAPLAALFIRFRSKTSYGERWRELLGHVPDRDYGNPVWFHTVSVGESMGARPLIMEFRKIRPDIPVVVTTTTVTGRAVYDSVGDRVTHLYAPLDSPRAVRRFLERVQPRLYVTMETELWPVLLSELEKRRIPAVVMNARLSDRSRDRYLKTGEIFQEVIGSRLSRLVCQTPADAANFAQLGIPEAKMAVSGSVKFDIAPDTAAFGKGRELRKRLCLTVSEKAPASGEPLFLAVASTHRGEELQALDIFRKLKSTLPSLVMIIIPRHPERFQEVWDLMETAGFRHSRRTLLEKEAAASGFVCPELILGDSMNELYLYFGMADLVLMGGSLVDIGGHNPLEPASLGCPVVTGPFIRNFRKIYQEMAARGASRVIPAASLPDDLKELLGNPGELQKLGSAGKIFIDANRGALRKTLEEITRVLDENASKTGSSRSPAGS